MLEDDSLRFRFEFGPEGLGQPFGQRRLPTAGAELSADDDFPERMLYIGISRDFEAGSAIAVADNGTGFQGGGPENLVRPFFTYKPDGIG